GAKGATPAAALRHGGTSRCHHRPVGGVLQSRRSRRLARRPLSEPVGAMLKERARLLNVSVFSLDLALVAVAFVAAHWVRSAVLPQLAHGSFRGELYA